MIRLLALVAVVLALAGCGSSQKADVKILEQTLRDYASAVRWGDDPSLAIAFIDPKVLEAKPIDRFELERLRQVQVAGYRERPYAFTGELRVRQVVQIELVNRHTQEARSIVDVQDWRYDPETKRWWLTSGLPRMDAAR